jgi:recombination protein RecA
MSKGELETQDERIATLLKSARTRLKDKERAALGNDPVLHLATIPTGIAELDRILDGGWRLGRMGLVVGEASMGKTLVTQWTIAAFQRQGLVCGFVDPERTFEPAWFTKTGVDVSKLIVIRPGNTEQAFDMVTEWLVGGMDLVVIDSLAALVPKMRQENPLEERQVMGLSAAKISEGLARVTSANTRSFILCTNQLRSKIGVVYGSPDTIPGGRAQRFYASYILHARRGGWIMEEKKRVGYELKLITEKSKVAAPFQECSIPFLFSGVIDTVGGLVELAKELGVLSARAGFYRWEGRTIRGLPAFKAFLVENPAATVALQAMVTEAAQKVPDFGEETPMDEGTDEDLDRV